MMVNPEFRKQIFDSYLHEKLGYCYQCNRCTEHCPVAAETDNEYNPRQLILTSLLGINIVAPENELSIFGCTMCDTCDEVCPNDIPLTHIFSVIKNIAAVQGIMPDNFRGQGKALYEFGTSVPVGPAIARRRIQMGLPEKYDLPVEELKTILKETGFEDLIKKLNPPEA
ncbi:MAG: 4Fe-4S dicluster domain-containing protein [Promethearchaeota archaeon]